MSKVCTRMIIMGDEDFAADGDVFQCLWKKSDFFAEIFHARCAIIFTDVDKYSSVRIAAIFADKKRFLTSDAKVASCQKPTIITHVCPLGIKN